MNPQNGTVETGTIVETDTAVRPLPPEILAVILIVSAIVIAVFAFAMRSFIRAGKNDAQSRRRRGATAKDPLDPHLPSDEA